MIRVLGSFCILGGGLLAVWQTVRERQKKRELTKELITALRSMEEGISNLGTPLPRLMEEQARRCRQAVPLFENTLRCLKQGDTLSQAWRCGCSSLPLDTEGKRVLESVFSAEIRLCSNLCNVISLASGYFEKQLAEQVECQSEQTKRTAALYLSGAALLVILLI